MVESSRHMDLSSLSLHELTAAVNQYPWFSAARMELCRRMFAMGENAWTQEEFAAQALYVADRSKFSDLVRGLSRANCADKDVKDLLSSYMADPAPEEEEKHQVRVVGGDYFSQAQYDKVRDGNKDGIFSRMALKMRPDIPVAVEESTEIADRFATETLAGIFVEQGRFEEAKRIYSRLILEIPEKSAYFASLIEKLDQLD